MLSQTQGWQWGGTGPKDEIFAPVPHGFFLPHPRPASHDGENFLPYPYPLRSREAPPYIVKLYFLLIFPTTITIFANKMTYFNKILNTCYYFLLRFMFFMSVLFFFYIGSCFFMRSETCVQWPIPLRDGNGAGRVRRMVSSPPSYMVLSYPIPTLPHMTGKILLPHPHPLGTREAPPHPIKLCFLLTCPQLLQLFLIKYFSLIKINLKLQINLSHQIKLIFSKK